MKFSKFNLFICFLVIGFFLISLDFNVDTKASYPNKYANSQNVIGEFQYYTIASNYGGKCTYKMITEEAASNNQSGVSSNNKNNSTAQEVKVIDKVFFTNIHVDVLNDFVGFLLIFIGCLGLKKSSKRFNYAAILAFCGMILRIIISALPFIFNNLILCNTALVLGLAYTLCLVFTSFCFVGGLLTMCPDICCRDERKWSKMAWFVAAVLQILVIFVFWLGSDFKMLYNLGTFFEVVMGIFILIFWLVLKRAGSYIAASYEKDNN